MNPVFMIIYREKLFLRTCNLHTYLQTYSTCGLLLFRKNEYNLEELVCVEKCAGRRIFHIGLFD